MFGLIKKIFMKLLASIVVNASSDTKCVSLTRQICEIQPALIDLHPNEYSQVLHYYPFVVKLNKCVESCNTLNDLPNKVCVPNKTEKLNLNMFVETFDGRKCNSNQRRNNDKCWCECKKHNLCEKYYIWNPPTCSWENGKYLANIMDDSHVWFTCFW